MTIEPEWRSVSIPSVSREKAELSVVLEAEQRWPGGLRLITEGRNPCGALPGDGVHPTPLLDSQRRLAQLSTGRRNTRGISRSVLR